jgi:extracellular factor (EF) 3-hydroxypalmitic acid methyl ester biosynthesis protein
MVFGAAPSVVKGSLEAGAVSLPITVSQVHAHTLMVHFEDPAARPRGAMHFDRLRLKYEGQDLDLGPCQYSEPHRGNRRQGEKAAEEGHGRLLFDRAIYDFRLLLKSGRVTDLQQRLDQLPVILARQSKVKPAFRHLVSELRYDLQVYRSVFDDLERNFAAEPQEARWGLQETAIKNHYADFQRFFDHRLALLEEEVRSESRETHAAHGFFLRKQMWDLISASEFMLRTNLKPRGYSGDSQMMRMIYEDGFRGPTVFTRFMHHHPIGTPAAEAVRNRRQVVAAVLGRAGEEARISGGRARVLSVACGPAWELNDVLVNAEAFDRFRFVLIDQDPEALAEADEVVAGLETRHCCAAEVSLECDSVRTMLREADPARRWGQYQVVYSMGLFDYLTQPVARAILGKLFQLLAPGGELVVGNFHASHRTRIYMEYWMDWVLCTRTEEELLDLASELAGAQARVEFEASGSQMFLHLRRP